MSTNLNMPNVIEAQQQSPDKLFQVKFQIVNPEDWNKWGNLTEQFLTQFKPFFKEVVFECHKYLIRCTPMLSGRLRAGLTSILNKYNIDYSAAFMDVTLIDAHNAPLDQSAITEGIQLSSFEDTDESVTLINSVPYADYVESGTSIMESRNYTRKAMYKSEHIMLESFNNWLRDATIEFEIKKDTVIEETA